MNQKNTFVIILGVIILIIFISGCTKLVEEKPIEPTPTVKKPVVSEANQTIIGALKTKLNSSINTYNASYSEEHEVHSYAGHSGATDYTEKSNITIKVTNGQVTNYTIKHTKEGWPVEKEDYYKYYDKSKNKLCQEKIISESSCNTISLNPPELGKTLTGCKISLYPDGKGKCKCNGELKPIEDLSGFACSEDKNTENMTIRYGHAIYHPETKQGFCYYETNDPSSKQLWAFECNQENFELKPLVTNNLEPLKNITCYQYGHSSCICNFDPIKTLVCSKDKPLNFDSETKSNILNYLGNIKITSISEEDNQYGHCYNFSHDKLEHTFCFNEQNSITFAKWGKDIRRERSTSVNINKIEMI